MKSAVLFLVFNRPETTLKVFDAIRAAKPPRLYVAADGPRAGRAGDDERCNEVRRIATNVTWPCEIRTLFRDANLGCKVAPSSAITWFFEQEEEGIILEDDCLPSRSFFAYCDELLGRYREDERVFLISGYNKQNEWNADRCDYFFSNYGGISGWASWRRAWRHFDIEMTDLAYCIENNLFEYLLGEQQGKARRKAMERVKRTNIDAWDYQWGFARHKNNGLACVPAKSLIQNIGYGPGATHTSQAFDDGVSSHDLEFPLRRNPLMVPDRRYDEKYTRREGLLMELARAIKHKLSTRQ